MGSIPTREPKEKMNMSTRFVYLRDLSTRRHTSKGHTRGVPVAVIMTDVNREQGTVSYAVAAAHPKDHFNKGLGRKIAAGRMKENATTLDIEPGANGHDINTAVMNDIYLVSKVSERVKEFASKWLTMARIPKDNLQTIPSPSLDEETEIPRGRHAIPPPPPLPHA